MRTVKVRLSLRSVRWAAAAVMWAIAGTLALSPVGAPHALAADSGSAVTVSGTGPFASLKVTVSQTKNLIDQVVNVTWTGGTPTPSSFTSDYLQIMQCWSDDPAGPTRQQCEFGNSADTRGGDQVRTRQLNAGPSFVDPLETQVAPAGDPYNYVPFESAAWEDDPANPGRLIHPLIAGDRQNLGKAFDQQSTNELPLNATNADGTGASFFETMTAEEAPGLGCGSTTTDASGAAWSPKCWLVVVPRGETEVNGAPYTTHGLGLATSPLSATNWAQRLVVPLQFNPLAISCPIGSPEQRTSGQEAAAEAVSRWQAQLCKQSGTVYSFSRGASDDGARRLLASSSPGLDFLTQPQPSTARAADQVVYAPVAVSAAVIAFNIDYSPYGSAALKPLAGQRVPQLNLTPRLVAKLITQSYRGGAPAFDPPLYDNPHQASGLTTDPDFAAANPTLAGLNNGPGDVLMPFPPSDLIQELWTWVNADPAARAFLDGTPDPWGMTVNPTYLHITSAAALTSFPKADPYCAPQPPVLGTQPSPLCTLDYRPYANDMHDAARSAARGDSLERSAWSADAIPPHYSKQPPQTTGSQSVMAFTDAATAARYSLPVARLQNSSGQFVAPDAAGLTAGLAVMKPSGVAGVVVPDPATSNSAAYPLTNITYAATVPSALSSQARSDYADFIDYAVTLGQQVGGDVGQLPVGYLPLPHAQVTQALTMSVGLRNYVSPPATPTSVGTTSSPAATKKPTPKPTKPKPTKTPGKTTPPTPTTTSAPSPTSPPTDPTFVAPPPVTSVTLPTTVPGTTAPPSSAAAVTSAGPTTSKPPAPTPASPSSAEPSTRTVSEVTRTPGVPASSTRYAFIVVLAIGGLCALSGPGLLRWGSRRTR